MSVPSGAHAGQLTLKHCTYANEPADCGTLVVPENRHNPHSRLIALPITRVRAHTSRPGRPIFRLQGGPGVTNMDFPDATRFTARHDVVLVGYRGVDGSSRLDCPEVIASRDHSRDLLSTASLTSDAGAFHACATRLTGLIHNLLGIVVDMDLLSIHAYTDGRTVPASESGVVLAALPRRQRSARLRSVRMRCVIVDDSEEFLASATRLLESQGMQVIGRASSGEEAMTLTEELAPDVVLVDIMLGEEDGIGLARQLAEGEPTACVVLI